MYESEGANSESRFLDLLLSPNNDIKSLHLRAIFEHSLRAIN